MQKFTIFTIIFSTIVVTIIAELVVSDYLQKLYANPQNLQASAINTSDFENFVAPFDQVETEDSETSALARRLQEIAGDIETPSNGSQVADTPASPTPVLNQQSTPFSRVTTLLPALRVQGLTLSPKSYDNRLFQLINTESLDASRASFATLDIGNDVMGSIYELVFRTSVDAENAFDEIRILANSFPNIDTNQTNQFGDRSFYINNLVKVGEVFVVIQRDSFVYAFGYQRDFHETFKTFFGVLF